MNKTFSLLSKYRFFRNFLRTERMFWARRDWDDCTQAVSYLEISNMKRNITPSCSCLKRPSSVFSPLDCARKMRFSFFHAFIFSPQDYAREKIYCKQICLSPNKSAQNLSLAVNSYFTKELKNRAG